MIIDFVTREEIPPPKPTGFTEVFYETVTDCIANQLLDIARWQARADEVQGSEHGPQAT